MLSRLKISSVISDKKAAEILIFWVEGSWAIPPKSDISKFNTWYKDKGIKGSPNVVDGVAYRGLHFPKFDFIEDLLTKGRVKLDRRELESWSPNGDMVIEFANLWPNDSGLILSRNLGLEKDVIDVREAIYFLDGLGYDMMEAYTYIDQCEVLVPSICTYCDLSDIECVSLSSDHFERMLELYYSGGKFKIKLGDLGDAESWYRVYGIIRDNTWEFIKDAEDAMSYFRLLSTYDCG